MNSALWIAFQQKLAIRTLFLHQKKYIVFLVNQIKDLRKSKAANVLKAWGKNVNTEELDPNREVLGPE